MDGGQLRRAATLKSDDSILLEIQGKDCVALEVKYHRQCYAKYTSFLRHQKDEETTSSKPSHLYEKSFDTFCKQFVQTEIIENEGIFFMNKIKDVFVNIVKEEENVDASNYKTSRLKQRLQTKYPQLVFHATKRRNKSEVVHTNSMKKCDVVEIIACVDTSQSSCTDTDNAVDETGTSKSLEENKDDIRRKQGCKVKYRPVPQRILSPPPTLPPKNMRLHYIFHFES